MRVVIPATKPANTVFLPKLPKPSNAFLRPVNPSTSVLKAPTIIGDMDCNKSAPNSSNLDFVI